MTVSRIDDLLELLPIAFVWTETGATATTSLHFEPAPNFIHVRVVCSAV